ncbi:MAG: hypothetical protein AAFV93_01585 [Chloroflexota bacterium]
MDKNGKSNSFEGKRIVAVETLRVVLSGIGAQLSNNGGNITLINDINQIVHSVTYSTSQAVSGETIIF